MGSEMCIRDRDKILELQERKRKLASELIADDASFVKALSKSDVCLLYTSDAADERSSVDLGGRRIIKKKKTC